MDGAGGKDAGKKPVLRFAGYKEPWRQQLLGDLLTFKNGANAEKEQYGSGYKFINVLDIIQNDFITHDVILGSVELSEPEFKKNEVFYGDVLFQRSSETREEVGQANVYLDKSKTAAFGGFVIRGRAKGEYHPEFMNYLLRTDKARQEITTKSGGSTRYNIGQEALEGVSVILPNLSEQQKIAAFLSAVDQKIQQLKRKQELLERYKKGVVQKLFSRELRFKREDGSDYPEWEEKRLGDICSTFKSGEGITADEIDIGGEYPVYGGNGLRGFTDSFTHDGYYVLIGRQGALCGNINRVRGKVYISEHAIAVQCDKSSDTDWLAQLLTYMNLNRLSESSAQPGLAVNKLVQLKIAVPSLEEQSRIAGFLMALDAKVSGVAQAVAAAQKWKKGLLQQMFV